MTTTEHHEHGIQASFPDRQSIAASTEAMLDLLFPKVRLSDSVDADLLKQQMIDAFSSQIRIAMRHAEASDTPRDASEILAHLLQEMERIRKEVREDVQAAFENDPAAHGPEEVIASYPTYVAVGTHRLAHELHQLHVPLIPRMMAEYAHRLTGIDIHPGAGIGGEFFIDHGTGVVIGETAQIGDRVKLYQGVTLGASHFPKDEQGQLIRGCKRHPTVEDGVTIFANATILGGDTVIGARSIIGSNVWLRKSVPPDSFVTMEEPTLRIRTNGKQ